MRDECVRGLMMFGSTMWKVIASFRVANINFTNSKTLVGVATDRDARNLLPARM